MSKKKIYCNGDSYTAGVALADHLFPFYNGPRKSLPDYDEEFEK